MREKRLLLEVVSNSKNMSVEWFDSIGAEEVNVELADVESDEIVSDMEFEKVEWFDEMEDKESDVKDEEDDVIERDVESIVQSNSFTKLKALPEMMTEKNNSAKLHREKLVALQYRKVLKNKTPPKFQIVSLNVYPSCSCQGTKNGCKTKACNCVWFGQECQPACGCKENCPNMELARGEGKRIKIETSGVHGEGCFAEEDIGKGEFVGEYLGEIVAWFDQKQKKNQSKFLMETGDKDYLLDASRFGSKLAKMNHRMERMGANCEFLTKRVGGQWRVGVWALKDIAEGNELFANYGEHYRGHGLVTPYINKSLK